MELKDWAEVMDVELDEAQNYVEFAATLGKEKYAAVIQEAWTRLCETEEFNMLVTTLVTGNVVFDAKPAIKVDITPDVSVEIGINTP